jgi:hypothetical protein
VLRLARGSGRPLADVNELLAQYRALTKKGGCPRPPGVRVRVRVCRVCAMLTCVRGVLINRHQQPARGAASPTWPRSQT